MKTKLFIAGMFFCAVNFLTSCTSDEMESQPQTVVEFGENNEQTNIDPKK